MKKILSTMGLLTIALSVGACGDDDNVTLKNCEPSTEETAQTYSFTNEIVYTKSGAGNVTEFVSYMPIPQSDEYQTVESLSYSLGTIKYDANYGNKALVYSANSFPDKTLTLQTTFNVTPKSVRVDFSKVNPQPYDTNSEVYRRHLGNRGEYIDTSNPKIKSIGDELWGKSSDVVDYARRCYEYVATHFRYIKGDFRTLKQILKEGGGECGDFSTVVVNLLRYKNIPSRHILCLKLSGGIHVWVDFYVEGYGWIPLDAQIKNASPHSDYFGRYDGNCVVVAKDIFYDYGEPDKPINFLQTYCYWYWYTGSTVSFKGQHNTRNNGIVE